jgi:hypothetical protein
MAKKHNQMQRRQRMMSLSVSGPRDKKPTFNLMPEKLMTTLEKISGKTRNIKVTLCVVKILDIILEE